MAVDQIYFDKNHKNAALARAHEKSATGYFRLMLLLGACSGIALWLAVSSGIRALEMLTYFWVVASGALVSTTIGVTILWAHHQFTAVSASFEESLE